MFQSTSSSLDPSLSQEGVSTQEEGLEQWMIKFKFTQNMKNKIKESGLDLELLSITEEQDLRQFCSEFGFNSLEKIKFLGAVKKIPNATSGIKRNWVHISKEASSAMDQIKTELQKMEKSIKNNKTVTQELNSNYIKCENDITLFEKRILSKISKRFKELKKENTKIKNEKLSKLNNQLNDYKNYLNILKQSQVKQNELIENKSFTSNQVTEGIIKISKQSIKNNINFEAAVNGKLQLDMSDESNLNKIIASFGKIQSCNNPLAPIITSVTVGSNNNSININWKDNESKEDEIEIVGYKILYRKSDETDWKSMDINNNNVKTKLISNLEYETQYVFKMLSKGKYNNFSKDSNVMKIKTKTKDTTNTANFKLESNQYVSVTNSGLKATVNDGGCRSVAFGGSLDNNTDYRFSIKYEKGTNFGIGLSKSSLNRFDWKNEGALDSRQNDGCIIYNDYVYDCSGKGISFSNNYPWKKQDELDVTVSMKQKTLSVKNKRTNQTHTVNNIPNNRRIMILLNGTNTTASIIRN